MNIRVHRLDRDFTNTYVPGEAKDMEWRHGWNGRLEGKSFRRADSTPGV
jgi:hypothetical protein